jgi:hypothetical protein
MSNGITGAADDMIGRVYLEHGKPVTVLARWAPPPTVDTPGPVI